MPDCSNIDDKSSLKLINTTRETAKKNPKTNSIKYRVDGKMLVFGGEKDTKNPEHSHLNNSGNIKPSL